MASEAEFTDQELQDLLFECSVDDEDVDHEGNDDDQGEGESQMPQVDAEDLIRVLEADEKEAESNKNKEDEVNKRMLEYHERKKTQRYRSFNLSYFVRKLTQFWQISCN